MNHPLQGWNKTQCRSEGWNIYPDTTPFIGVWDGSLAVSTVGMTVVEADAKALAFVQQKAREGSAYHIDALARTQLL